MRIADTMVYLTDNGAALCGAHLGASARMTGRDISGQAIEPVTPAVAREFQSLAGGRVPECELCGRKASLIVTYPVMRKDGRVVNVTIPTDD